MLFVCVLPRLDRFGYLSKICFSVVARSSYLPVPAELVQDFYRAIICWHKICQSEKVRHPIRLEPGQLLILDNHRMAHGRSAIDDPRESGRCLRGGYFAWDDALSRFRHLHEKLVGTDPSEDDAYKPKDDLPFKFKSVSRAYGGIAKYY